MKAKSLVLGMLLFFTGSIGIALAQGATAAQYVAAGNQFYAQKDYAKAVRIVRKMGLDPIRIRHRKPRGA